MTIDMLEERLQNLSLETPDAGRVAARVLSSAKRPRARRLPRVVALGVAGVAMAVLVAYFVPAADSALASVPVAGDLLRNAGLVGAAARITSVGAVSTSSGYRMRLVAAYADSTRTVLLLHIDPAAQPVFRFNGIELRDQFGRTYSAQNGMADLRTGDAVVQFEALAWPDALTGARITLHVTQVETADITSKVVDGSWTLPATLGVDEGTGLPLAAPASTGPAHYRFTSVTYTPATIAIDIEVTGVTMSDLARVIPDGGKGSPAFKIDLLDPSGANINGSGSFSDDLRSVHIHFLAYRLGAAGNYVLRVRYAGNGEFERVLAIP